MAEHIGFIFRRVIFPFIGGMILGIIGYAALASIIMFLFSC